MNFDISSILGTVSGFFQTALFGAFGFAGISSETGNGLVNFVKFFEAGFVFLANLFTKLFSGLAG